METLGSLSLLDVRCDTTPAEELTGVAPFRCHVKEKPAKRAILASKPGFKCGRFSGTNQLSPNLAYSLRICRMSRSAPVPLSSVLGKADVLKPAPIEGLMGSVGSVGPGESGDSIDELPIAVDLRSLALSGRSPLRSASVWSPHRP